MRSFETNFNEFIQEKYFENNVCKIAAITSRPQRVKINLALVAIAWFNKDGHCLNLVDGVFNACQFMWS